jgi:ATP-dependent Lhr-like helicase
VLAGGEPVAFLERGGHAVATFPATAQRPDWPAGLVSLVEAGRYKSLEVRTVDGLPVREHPDASAALKGHGFADGYKGLVLRRR